MSTAETEHILGRLAQVTNVSERGEIKRPAVNLLRFRERREREEELRSIEEVVQAPSWAKTGMDGEIMRGMARRKRDIEKQLEALTPQPVSGATRDALARRERALAAQIQIGMPTVEEMRRNPVGAVGKHTRWAKANRLRVPEWKNIRVQQEPDSEDPDLANVEQLRPSLVPANGTSTFMVDAQIPGKFAMSPLAKENWPLGEPTAQTATSHLQATCQRCDTSVGFAERYCRPCLAILMEELEGTEAQMDQDQAPAKAGTPKRRPNQTRDERVRKTKHPGGRGRPQCEVCRHFLKMDHQGRRICARCLSDEAFLTPIPEAQDLAAEE